MSAGAGTPLTCAPPQAATVALHDLACGSYRVDIDQWLALAREAPAGPLAELGAGTGRVTLTLARASGRKVWAFEQDRSLAAELAARARGLPIAVVRADASDYRAYPAKLQFALVIAPQQLVQLVGARLRPLLAAAVRHLCGGGLLALALCTDSDLRAAGIAQNSWHELPLAWRSMEVDGWRVATRVVAVGRRGRELVIEREQRVERTDACQRGWRRYLRERLSTLEAHELERLGRELGLQPARRIALPADAESAPATIVVMRKARSRDGQRATKGAGA